MAPAPRGPSAPSARFIWDEATGAGRNVFLLFRRELRLASVPRDAVLHVFADTRYRVRVNGVVAGYGPARFVPEHPAFDSVLLGALLREGANVITVEVQHRGAPSYEHRPSRGGFVAWGRAGRGVDLSTPGDWVVRRLAAADPWAPCFSFAQGPVEITDLRNLEPAWFEPGRQVAGWSRPVIVEEGPWGEPEPRSIPPFGLSERLPQTLRLLAPLSSNEIRIGFRTGSELKSNGRRSEDGVRYRVPYAVHLHSPVDQDVVLGAFWGPHFLDGRPIERVKNAALGNREDYPVHLRAGWNFLYGEPECLDGPWSVLIGVPREAGLTAVAVPDLSCPHTLLHGDPLPEGELPGTQGRAPRTLSELPGAAETWHRVGRERPPLPARECGWDLPGEPTSAGTLGVTEIEMPVSPSRGAVAVLDFGREYLGHVVIEMTAPAGAVVDLVNDERLRPDGMIGLFTSHWGVNSADRCTWAGGRGRFEAFNERGGRWLQVVVRECAGPVVIHRVAIRQKTIPLPETGSYECSDPVLNWAFTAGVETQRASLVDGWIDPWRERGMYLGDVLVEAEATRSYTADTSIERWAVRLWAQAQMPDGQMQDVAPAHKDAVLLDYTFIWVLALRNYWAATGDRSLVREVWPNLRRVFESPAWVRHRSGLIDGVSGAHHVFIDWGTEPEARRGECGVLNAFRVAALDAAAELAPVAGRAGEAASFSQEAARVRKAFQSLWLADASRYAGTRIDGELWSGPAMHANILALRYGLVPAKRRPSVWSYVEEGMARNLGGGSGIVELYFMFYLLEALYADGRVALAEQVMRAHWGPMQKAGAWTLWETLQRGHMGIGSHCHGWSAAPLVFFRERVLGVRPEVPGKLSRMLLMPHASGLQFACGAVPHPAGPIEVDWSVHGDVLRLRGRAPRGVRLKPSAGPGLDHLRLDVDVASL